MTIVKNYLGRKQAFKTQNFERKYVEVSDKIRKVTYNTDFFDRNNFERRSGNSFNFDSGKIGKFIECEFEQPLKICMTRLTSMDEAQITFVIQASKTKAKWSLIAAFR